MALLDSSPTLRQGESQVFLAGTSDLAFQALEVLLACCQTVANASGSLIKSPQKLSYDVAEDPNESCTFAPLGPTNLTIISDGTNSA